MIRQWFTRDDAPLTTSFVKRFDPRHFTVDFPRGSIASVVLGSSPGSLKVVAEFQRPGDLIGLIYRSDDGDTHPVNRRELSRDYSHCKLSFRWRSSGLTALDGANGPTLTIEGRDAAGQARTWYVRLWNYATGSPTDATIKLDFDDIAGGFNLATDADPVDVRDIDRMFFNLVPEDYSTAPTFADGAVRKASLEITELQSDGSGSVLEIADAMVPEHDLRICTAYDDLYHIVPERLIESIEHLGYRKLINHYVGMSHYPRLTASGLIDPSQPLNSAAAAWHAAFAKAAREAGFEVIMSLSFELIASACPDEWKQRSADGSEALTGYEPPSTLVSPANDDAIDYLARTALAFAQVSTAAGLRPRIQIGEPWWWVTNHHRPCIYDDAARAAFGGNPLIIADVRGGKTAGERSLLDHAGALLAAATSKITAAVKHFRADAEALVLVYTPAILAADRPELYRANIPSGWASPAFDVLQVEDYEWLTAGREPQRHAAWEFLQARLNYPVERQHYLAGFAAPASARFDWQRIIQGARDAFAKGVQEVLVWALPQVLRDHVTIFDDGVNALNDFEDVVFPIEIGAEASVVPGFSTTVLTSASGHEFRNANWSQARLRFDAGPGVRGDEELKRLITFFRARRGSAQAFRFRDPYDHSSCEMTEPPTMLDQVIGYGDGSTTTFFLSKTYGSGEQRRITRPAQGSIKVAVNGLAQVLGWRSGAAGAIIFDGPPAAGAEITAGFLFDVPVRFASDQLEINRASFLAGEAPTVPLVEIRESVS